MRIASVIRPESINANYRARIPLVALSQQGHEFFLADAHRLPHANQFRGCDVVHFCRVWEEPFQRLARAMRARGIGVTWDCDDDLTAIERETGSYRIVGGFHARQVERDMRTMMGLAHVVTTPTEVLAGRFARHAEDVRVIENYLAPPMMLRLLPPRINPSLRVGWIAGVEHRSDVEPLRLREVLQQVLDRHPGVEVVTVGLGLGLRHERYHHVRHVELLELPQVAAQFDIALAPLADTPFNRARSNIKLKEYAIAGTAWLASDVAPYDGLGEVQGGWLLGEEEWFDAISDLLADEPRRRRLALLGRSWAKRQGILQHAHLWEETFAVAAQAGREAPEPAARR